MPQLLNLTIPKQIKDFVSQRPLLSTVCILLFEFGFLYALLYYSISGPIIGTPPLTFLIFPGLPLLHVLIFLVNRKSPKNEIRILAKYTLYGHVIILSLVITYLIVF